MEVEFEDAILTFKKSLTVKELLDNLQLNPLTVIVKKNSHIALENTILNPGDKIKIIPVIYGG